MKRTALIAVVVMGLVFGLVAYAGAATSGSVAVTATVNPQMEITVPSNLTLNSVAGNGLIDPLNDASGTITISGRSNKNASLTAVITTGNFTQLTNSIGTTAVSWGKGGGLTMDDTITGKVDWTKDAGTILNGSVMYTITQP